MHYTEAHINPLLGIRKSNKVWKTIVSSISIQAAGHRFREEGMLSDHASAIHATGKMWH